MIPYPISLAAIRIDGGTQPRCKLDESHVADLIAYPEWIDTQPLITFWDGAEHWLADGFHRYHALCKLGKDTAQCTVLHGMKRDAILYSVGANVEHGLKRTNGDKRKAVLTLLQDKEWGGRSDMWIAEHCRVSEELVSNMRRETGLNPPTRTLRDGRVFPARETCNTTKQAEEDTPAAPSNDWEFFEKVLGLLDQKYRTFPSELTAAILPRVEDLRRHTITMLEEYDGRTV